MSINEFKPNNISKLVLFDIDHTLISNGGASRRALYQALQQGLSISLDKIEQANLRLSGKTDPQIIREFIVACLDQNKIANHSEDYWQRKIDEIIEFYLQFLPKELEKVSDTEKYFMHSGVIELLTVLEENENIALGLLTGNVEKGARIKLERFQLNRYFPVGAYGCDSPSRLDLPAIAHIRAQKYYKNNWTPKQIIIIGDAENDILCAKHYGAVSLAINTGTTTWDELSQLCPDYLFSCLSDTQAVLEAIILQNKVVNVSSRTQANTIG